MSITKDTIKETIKTIMAEEGDYKAFFKKALEKAGIKTLDADIEEYIVKEIISHKDEITGSEIILMPSDEYQVTTMVDFGTKILGTQNATLDTISDFKEEIAGARTFSFLHEIEMLLENDLIKGGDLNNAIVYVDKELSNTTMQKLKKAFKKEDIKVKSNGILAHGDSFFSGRS